MLQLIYSRYLEWIENGGNDPKGERNSFVIYYNEAKCPRQPNQRQQDHQSLGLSAIT